MQVGARDEVLRSPADPGVARLVGMTNLLPAEVAQARAGRLRLRLANGRMLSGAGRAPPGTAVWVGVRPENVRLESARGDPAASGERAEVVRLVSDGVVATAWLLWDGLELRTHLVAGRGLGLTLKPGEPVAISIRADDVHVMPRDPDASDE
jgi:ABC-type Fe3+/spermidine/putrescine transport system ATPase subunit